MKDSICVFDLCGRYGNEPANLWADYFPAENATRFGGMWGDVPDMPCSSEPSEDAVCAWAHAHPGWLDRKLQAKAKRKAARDAEWLAIDRRFEAEGHALVTAGFRLPCGTVKRHSEATGLRDKLSVWRGAMAFMLRKLPAGTVLCEFRHVAGLSIKQLESMCEKTGSDFRNLTSV